MRRGDTETRSRFACGPHHRGRPPAPRRREGASGRARRLSLVGGLLLATGLGLAFATGCRDVRRYSSHGDHYEGEVVKGSFVRAGVAEDAKMCLVLDAEHLQDGPGTLSTSDGRFRATPLRPIPQIWHDPLSTLSFGDGRRQNLVYMATPLATPLANAADTQDVMVILSLMAEGGVEIRLVRGAPQADAQAPGAATPLPMFGVFTLGRSEGACTF